MHQLSCQLEMVTRDALSKQPWVHCWPFCFSTGVYEGEVRFGSGVNNVECGGCGSALPSSTKQGCGHNFGTNECSVLLELSTIGYIPFTLFGQGKMNGPYSQVALDPRGVPR
jgi:hypothetical protein